MRKQFKYSFAKISFVWLGIIFCFGCEMNTTLSREEFLERFPKILKYRYQTNGTCRVVDDTFWAYLPTTSTRRGMAETEIKDGNSLFLEYSIASFNPFRVKDPPELRHIIQKTVREIRDLQLKCRQPFRFFVLVVSPIDNPFNKQDEHYIGFYDDLKKYRVGVDFSGEGFARLVWDQVKVGTRSGSEEDKTAASFQDKEGEHVPYHNVTMREFIEKQIKWRIYKRFTLEYNTVPFDLSEQEKLEAIIHIVKTVILGYNFNEFERFYLNDSTFFSLKKTFHEHPLEEIKRYNGKGLTRKSAF